MSNVQSTSAEIVMAPPVKQASRSPASASCHNESAHCSTCAMRNICMPSDLTKSDFAKLDSVIHNWRMVRRGEALYRAGDIFQSIYALRAGSFKTSAIHADGREQVTGFHLSGESFGMDGICTDVHSYHAVALEDSAVCVIPFHLLECLCREIPSMQHHLHKLMSAEIVRESSLMLLLGNMSAEERVAAILLNISQRLQARGYSPTEFTLRMTREDIGSYLGMKLETVSRMFSQFQRAGLLQVQNKQIRLLDVDGLRKI